MDIHSLALEFLAAQTLHRRATRCGDICVEASATTGCVTSIQAAIDQSQPGDSDLLGCQLRFSPSRQAMASSSTRTASSTAITGRACISKAGKVEQNL